MRPSMSNRAERRRLEKLARKEAEQATRSRGAAAGRPRSASQQAALAASLSLAARAGDRYAISVLERFDGMAGLRNGLRKIADEKGHWAGIPMPLEGTRLVIEPRYPHAEALGRKIGAPPDDPAEETLDGAKIRNRFWSFTRRTDIIVWNEADGSLQWGPAGTTNQAAQLLSTLSAADAWGIEQERNAIDTLGTMVPHRLFKQYLLTGMFMERSRRSGVHYLFRRLRPTLAISTTGKHPRILAALCLHPIAYYEGSWAGAMCPTDDVIAHLALMRGDEHMLWRRANQHAPWRKEAGI